MINSIQNYFWRGRVQIRNFQPARYETAKAVADVYSALMKVGLIGSAGKENSLKPDNPAKVYSILSNHHLLFTGKLPFNELETMAKIWFGFDDVEARYFQIAFWLTQPDFVRKTLGTKVEELFTKKDFIDNEVQNFVERKLLAKDLPLVVRDKEVNFTYGKVGFLNSYSGLVTEQLNRVLISKNLTFPDKRENILLNPRISVSRSFSGSDYYDDSHADISAIEKCLEKIEKKGIVPNSIEQFGIDLIKYRTADYEPCIDAEQFYSLLGRLLEKRPQEVIEINFLDSGNGKDYTVILYLHAQQEGRVYNNKDIKEMKIIGYV